MQTKPSPTGIIRAYAGASAPGGYLLCDGASYLRADYPALFAIIGTAFGAADGTHFNVPDAKSKIFIGKNGADTSFDVVGETGGANSLNLAHTHTANNHTHTMSGTTSASSNQGIGSSNDTNFASPSHTHTMTINAGNQSANTSDSQLSATQSILIPYITLNWIIKA